MKTLLVEDNPGDARLIQETLAEAGLGTQDVTHVTRLADALGHIAQGGVEVILLDLSLPDSRGLDTVRRIHQAAAEVPIVVLTGLDDEWVGTQALHEGAQDYLIKGQVDGQPLLRAMRYARERRRQQSALLRVQQDFRQAIEQAPEGVLVLREGKCIYVNPAWAACLGYDPKELIGRSPLEFMTSDDRAAAVAGGHTFRDTAAIPSAYETRFVRKDGKLATLEISPYVAIEFEGAPVLLAMARNVTERKDMEARLIVADRLAALGVLAAGIAHEINNPLTYVIANLDLIAVELLQLSQPPAADGGPGLDGERIERIAGMAVKAREGSARVQHIVRQLRSFSHAEAEQQELLDVRSVIKASIAIVEHEIRHRAAFVEDYGEVPLVEANETRLMQVFLNLLINASQSIPEGAADRNEIRLATRTDAKQRAVVEIRDTGGGISPDVMGKIFDPFFTTKTVGGTGLGLSISQAIVAALGGEITVESRVGMGSTFRVVLPGTRIDQPVEETRPAPPPRGAARRGRILIVDDELEIGEVLKQSLADAGSTEAVTSGQDALRRLAAGERYDVILCDVLMPVMTGIELYSAISRLASDQAARMIFMTAGAFIPRVRAFLERIPNAHIDKPFDLDKLHALIEERLR